MIAAICALLAATIGYFVGIVVAHSAQREERELQRQAELEGLRQRRGEFLPPPPVVIDHMPLRANQRGVGRA